MTLYEMLDCTLYYQQVWIYDHNAYDQNMPLFKGEVNEARYDHRVWDYLLCKVDHYECNTGILLIYVKDEYYEKRFEEGNYTIASRRWGKDKDERPWRHSAEVHMELWKAVKDGDAK